jgi:hypothetical protein
VRGSDNHTVRWYKNPGHDNDGWEKFKAGSAGSSTHGHVPDGIRIADIDGDGDGDIVVAEEAWASDAEIARAMWFEQTGDPRNESSWVKHELIKAKSLNNMDVADMDGDGDPDIVLGEHRYDPRRTLILENRANGADWVVHEVDRGKEGHIGARVFDLDGDGDFDIVTQGFDQIAMLHMWRNDADPPVAARPRTEPGAGMDQSSLSPGMTTPLWDLRGRLIYSGGGLSSRSGSPMASDGVLVAPGTKLRLRAGR